MNALLLETRRRVPLLGPCPGTAAAMGSADARSTVISLLQRAHAAASTDGALEGVADGILGCLRSLDEDAVTASSAPETRQQGSQASAEMCNDSAQTTVCSTDASAQVKPMVADSVSQAGVQVATSSSQVGERAVFRQIGENNR